MGFKSDPNGQNLTYEAMISLKVKTKLENELKSVTADYDDIARELKLADDRANKASGDAAHFESLMREEHARLVQLDQAKKALETEVGEQKPNDTFSYHFPIFHVKFFRLAG